MLKELEGLMKKRGDMIDMMASAKLQKEETEREIINVLLTNHMHEFISVNWRSLERNIHGVNSKTKVRR